MTDVLEFIEGKLAEVETAAHYALSRDGELPTDQDWGGWWLGHYQHYRLHDPAAVLAWVAGIRAVVALHTDETWTPTNTSPPGVTYVKPHPCGGVYPCPTLRAIAGIWGWENE